MTFSITSLIGTVSTPELSGGRLTPALPRRKRLLGMAYMTIPGSDRSGLQSVADYLQIRFMFVLQYCEFWRVSGARTCRYTSDGFPALYHENMDARGVKV